MKSYLPIQWHTGMLMLAQHFQQQAKFNEFQLSRLMDAICPFMFGVIDCKFTYDNDVFTLTKLEALMPNLLPVVIAEESECINLDLSKQKMEPGVKYKIYLSVPQADLLEQSMQVPEPVGPVVDDFDHENKEVVVKLKPNLRLIVDKTLPVKHYSICLCEITLVSNQFVFSDFEPVGLKLDEQKGVYKKLQKLQQTLRSKLFYLKVQDQWSDVNLQGIKNALLSNLFTFEQQLSVNAHPYYLFQELLRIAGSMACIATDSAPKFEYDHEDQTQSFVQCLDYISKVLDEIKEQYSRTELIIDGKRLKIPLKNLTLCKSQGRKYFILSANMLQNYEFLDDWITSCVIATDSIYENALQNRVLGAKRTIVDYVDQLHAKSNKTNLFFLIEYDPTFINLKDEFLFIYNDKDTKETPTSLFGYLVE